MATRTHNARPSGLSLGSIIRRHGHRRDHFGRMRLGGRNPRLDIKPYVPFCDAVRDAVAPAWVRRGGARKDDDDDAKGRGEKDEKTLTDEPLEIAAVRFDASAQVPAVAAASLRSVKARRVRRLAGLTAAELCASRGRTSKRARPPSHSSTTPPEGRRECGVAAGGGAKTRSGVVITAELRRRVVARRRRGAERREAVAGRRCTTL